MDVSSSLVQSVSNLRLLDSTFGTGTTPAVPAAASAPVPAQPSVPAGLTDFLGLVGQLQSSAATLQQASPDASGPATSDFVSAYNNLVSQLTQNDGYANFYNPQLLQTLQQAFQSQSGTLSQLVDGGVPAVAMDVSQQMAAGALATLGAVPGALPADLYNSLGTYDLVTHMSPDQLKGLLLDKQA